MNAWERFSNNMLSKTDAVILFALFTLFGMATEYSLQIFAKLFS